MRWFPLLLLAACAASPDDIVGDDEPVAVDAGKADGALANWTAIGTGVIYQRVNAGDGIVIAYGGYTARLVDSAAWATELVDQELGAAGVGHIYAVKGPADAAYAAREIANSKLRAHLATLAGDAPIVVVAHSSGAFVAHELLAQLDAAAATTTLARIRYADLDGGGSGLTDDIVGSLGGIEFVYARDPAAGLSRNSSVMQSLADTYAPAATAFEVTVAQTGCNQGASWCLHDVVITHRPHNPTSYDLARDYTDFANRPVTTEYLAPLLAP